MARRKLTMRGKKRQPLRKQMKVLSRPIAGSALQTFAIYCSFRHNGEQKTKVISVTGFHGKSPSVTRRALIKLAKLIVISKKILAPFSIGSFKDLERVSFELEEGALHE